MANSADSSSPPKDLSPELPASVAELLARARAHGLELAAEREELDTMGLDFVVAHARDASGAPWIVRAPRRADVIAAARVEGRVLGLVGPRLPVAVPGWRIHAADVIAYVRIEGVPAVSLTAEGPVWNIVDPSAPAPVFIESCARTLAALQAIAPEDAEAAGVPVHTIAAARAEMAEAMRETRAVLQPSAALWDRWQRWIDDDASWPEHVALVHGDFHPGHWLLASDGRLVGVLDWTEARVGDPSIDLALFFGCFGRAALARLVDDFVAAGGRAWPRIVEHAAERWAASAAKGAQWALRHGNDAVLEFTRAQMQAIEAETAG